LVNNYKFSCGKPESKRGGGLKNGTDRFSPEGDFTTAGEEPELEGRIDTILGS
jgi:hypothetical protein